MTAPTKLIVTAALIIFVVLAATLVFFQSKRDHQFRRDRLSTRDPITITQFNEQFVPNVDRETVEECLEKISKITGSPVNFLRPDDRFEVELALPKGGHLAGEWDDIEEHVIMLEKVEGRQSPPLSTVKDYIYAVWKLKQKPD